MSRRRRPASRTLFTFVWLDLVCDECLSLPDSAGDDVRVGSVVAQLGASPFLRSPERIDRLAKACNGMEQMSGGMLRARCGRCQARGRQSQWWVPRVRAVEVLQEMERAGVHERRMRLSEVAGILDPVAATS